MQLNLNHSPECSSYSASLQHEPNLESRALSVGCCAPQGELELMFDDFIPGDTESPHAAPEGVCDDANLGNNDTSVGFPPLLPPRSPNSWEAIVLASEVTTTECESQDNAHGHGDNRLLDQREAFLVKNNGVAFYMNHQHKVQTGLRAILQKFYALTMYAFDEVQKWAHESAKMVKYDSADKKLSPLASYTKSVFQRFDLHGTNPMLAPLTLPVKERAINVVVHDACQQVYSQLTNSTLMADPNLNFTNDDPFAPPPESPSVLGDINTGSRFREAYNVLYTIPGLHVFCPLIFFIDKTHTDTFGNLCLDPVTFTLGIFKRHLRNQPKVWQTLGYITNQSHHGSKGKAKAVDLQAILKVIMRTLRVVSTKTELSGGSSPTWRRNMMLCSIYCALYI